MADVDIDVMYLRETERAWLVAADEETDPVWIPKSQSELEEPGAEGERFSGFIYTLTLPEWMADREGLI